MMMMIMIDDDDARVFVPGQIDVWEMDGARKHVLASPREL
jgi:hypothetical protein